MHKSGGLLIHEAKGFSQVHGSHYRRRLIGGYDALAQSNSGSGPAAGREPNILLIPVDGLRYPTVFPTGIITPGEFFKTHMPNVHYLWENGLKFGEYHTAANACTPWRGVMISGLYSQQNWLLTTTLSTPPDPNEPSPPARHPVLIPLIRPQ